MLIFHPCDCSVTTNLKLCFNPFAYFILSSNTPLERAFPFSLLFKRDLFQSHISSSWNSEWPLRQALWQREDPGSTTC